MFLVLDLGGVCGGSGGRSCLFYEVVVGSGGLSMLFWTMQEKTNAN